MTKGYHPVNSPDFSGVLEQSTLPVALCETNGKALFLNQAYLDYFVGGPSEEESVSSRFVHEETWQEIVHYCTNYGEWDSYGILFKPGGEEIILKVKASSYKSPDKEKFIALFFTETNEARRRIFRQGQLLKASSEASTLLVTSKDVSEALDSVVKSMGKAVQADRCYVYESTFLPDSDQIYASKVAQWERNETFLHNEDIQMVSYTILPLFYETLYAGKPYNKTRNDFADKSGRFMESRQIQSLICLPIFRDNVLWGFMGFDDCQEPRKWDEQEVASLTLLTNSLSSVLSNTELRIELEKKNNQLESAIRGSKDSLWDYDIQKERLYYSPQFLELLGYSEGELKGNLGDLLKIVHQDDLTKLFHRLQEMTKGAGKIKDRELRLTSKKGTTIWVRVTARTHVDMSGNAVRISGSNTDITVEKTYEKKIEESQEKYIELVDNLRETVFQLSSDGKIVFLNRAWKMLTGHSLNQSIGNYLADYVDKLHKPEYQKMQKKLLEESNSYLNCTVLLKGKDGKEGIWTEIYGRSIAKKGSAPYILGTIIDVSQRRLAEEKLKENEARYRLITENISDLVTLQDAKGRFIYVSPSVKTVLGMSPKDLLGKSPQQIWQKQDLEGTAWEKDNFDVNNTSRKSYIFKKHNGSTTWLETMRSLVYAEGDDGYIIQSATRDISAFKEAENNLKAALDQQRELIELKSNFISMASHEFRTPLTTIRSSVQLLEEYGKASPEEQRVKMDKHYGRIKEQIERVTRLMNDVLTLGKFDAGRTPFHSSQQDILRFMQELISDHFSNQPDGRSVHFHCEGKATPVLFDASLLSHVMINLISNAFKYSEGKKNPEIFVVFNPKKLQIIVKDYGIGIPKEDLDRVFESFYRSKNAINVPGTGLGLVITKEFVELHKGTIRIESELNKETSVIVELPT